MAPSSSQVILLLPLLLIACDLWCAFTIPKPRRDAAEAQRPPLVQSQQHQGKDPNSLGGNFHISFCTSCSFKNAAMQTKAMLESKFPESSVALSNFPPPMAKRMLGKVVPVMQYGVMGLVLGGEHVFRSLGYAAPPPWYNSLRQNKFGTVASSWLIGNMLQNFLMNTGAFEVYYDGDLVFSKLQAKRFPTDMELQERVLKRKAEKMSL